MMDMPRKEQNDSYRLPSGLVPCKICRVAFHPADLDADRRCKSCRDAKNATDNHTTYGKYIGARYASLEDGKARKQRQNIKYCRYCSTVIPKGGGVDGFCSKLCKEEFGKREAILRGAVPATTEKAEKKKSPKPEQKKRYCIECGKELPQNLRRYCNARCKYLHNMASIQASTKKCKERLRAQRPPKFCQICGKQITVLRRHKYCSQECADIGEQRKQTASEG